MRGGGGSGGASGVAGVSGVAGSVDARSDASAAGAAGDASAGFAGQAGSTDAATDVAVSGSDAGADADASAGAAGEDAAPPCGDLGEPCCAGDTCAQGAYRCDATIGACTCALDCNGSCRDPDSDRYNCGSCGHVCGLSCSGGVCTTVLSMAAGGGHSCALLSDHSVRCWGWNFRGQLGDGTNTDRLMPVTVPGADGAVGITAGREHTCAWYADGSAKCWGDNQYGQLGDGTTSDRNVPAAVLTDATHGLQEATSVVAGAYTTCAVTNGQPKCWGRNDAEQIPMYSHVSPLLYPYAEQFGGFPDPSPYVAVGASHICVATASSIQCFGSNVYGQMKPGVPAGTVEGLTAGDDFTCWWGTDGATSYRKAACWGDNQYYQLGDGTTYNTTTGAVDVQNTGSSSNALGVEGVSAGARFACAWASNDGECWGDNTHGQLDDGTTVSGLPGRSYSNLRVAAGADHACGWHAGLQEAFCWGANVHGQIGDGTTVERLLRVKVKW